MQSIDYGPVEGGEAYISGALAKLNRANLSRYLTQATRAVFDQHLLLLRSKSGTGTQDRLEMSVNKLTVCELIQ